MGNAAPSYAVSPAYALLLRDMGLSPARLLRRAGLPADLFSRGSMRLPAAQYHAVWSALEAEAGPTLPVRIAQALSVEAFDPLLFAVICSPDLARAARRLTQYKPLIAPFTVSVEASAHELTLRATWPTGLEPPRSLGHTELLLWVSLTRLSTRAEVRPTRVTAPVAPADAAGLRAYLGTDVRRGPAWAVTFSAADAARPFLTANEGMWAFFEPELRRRLAELDEGANITQRVRAALLEALPAGEVQMEAVARRLAVSKRTLQRRLNEEDTTFQQLLSATRESLALHYLRQSQLSASEIAFLLGYEDPNSFFRAFGSWTGRTPEAVRVLGVSR